MKAFKQAQSWELDIVDFSKKGNGKGILKNEEQNNLSLEVPFSIPGDRIKALVQFKRRAKKQLGKLEEVLKPSPSRIPAKCSHFGTCGGCRWQQLEYEKQLQIKEQNIRTLFAPFLTPHVQFLPIVPCQNPWQFRNKMEFSFSTDLSQNKYLGLIMDSSRGKVFNLTECHLTHSWFVEALKAVREWWESSKLDAYHHYRNTGSLRTLTLREGQRTGDRMIILTVSGNADYALHKSDLEFFVAILRQRLEPERPECHLSIFLRIQQIAKGMATQFYEMVLYGPDHIREILYIQSHSKEQPIPLEFNISPSAFFQPNTRQAEQLYSLALQLSSISSPLTIYDLYCGTGTFSICLSKLAKTVVGVEICPEAVLDAQSNAAKNGCTNVYFLCGAVHEQLHKIAEKNLFPMPDLVVVDPPRAGLDPHALQQLIQLNPKKILYVSCNPITQADNISNLISQGYRLEIVQPVDQFPHTIHIENIAILTKDEK
ncbi:23S rRNA (uracil(1939)-C(5))-methyltransferase RlmD [Parachlamydia sp. AcF125]|uniref:23S rRNA (uracil(1939)-C(5))-methyltransferase RlmD n=1 Tax=Parachlamydia sp. AcF125 TaxID=2795736 RepID=UPI001BC918A0|nr:23S rRNA (uracil(1939)-C(5))-methyltransferase RlmD [Parachlamydia sp. AcF125]MBS4167612.1 23S rRNA (uracil-C(5))-methyltransferase RlmCD [Parachlamydia sp. AcF125]